ncbi:ATP-binding protein [Mesotoga prima]|uniref:ATP-binding protein n=1 Tax=Mesotoga prima TaxID=1184387 RepID=UPI003D8122A6
MTSAIIDRLVHHCHLIVFTGRSYRLETLTLEVKQPIPGSGFLSGRILYFLVPKTGMLSDRKEPLHIVSFAYKMIESL